MKTKALTIASLALVLVLSLSAWTSSQSIPQETRTITVTGDAEVRVVPDEVMLTLGVQTWDKNLDKAKRQNDEIVARRTGPDRRVWHRARARQDRLCQHRAPVSQRLL